MDDVTKYNKERWEELATAGVDYSRPYLNMDRNSAQDFVDPKGVLGNFDGKDVLCLAGGGGQQSAAFALLGAKVTVLDITETQLKRDQEAATHHGVDVATVQGDMQDLSAFEGDAFDLVYQPHSINFVPDVRAVFAEVARVLRPGGLYWLDCANPFIHGIWEDDFNGIGYTLTRTYADGEVVQDDLHWDFVDPAGEQQLVLGPREFKHTLGTLVGGLVANGFVILGLDETMSDEPDPEPGTWEHFKSVAPPWLGIWSRYAPDAFG